MSKQTTKITVTRALATLKILDKKITKTIRHGVFANYTVGGKPNVKEYTPDADLQSVNDLITHRSRLKSEIMKSNAKTKVKIGDVKMTVVEAIETKDSIKYKRSLAQKMISDLNSVESTVNSLNYDVQERLDTMIRASFSSDSKPTEKDYDAIAKPYLKNNEAKEVDSDKYKGIAVTLMDEIDVFESEVDLVLSESNSTTYITV